MTSVQERLKQSRTPLDKWSIREQLCLASAVSCSGDQNWMSVSRTMKLVCGTGVNSLPRPANWYSQKSCAVQYGNLLENVETPKRKKRTSESSGNDTPTTVETPTDLVLRKLTEERMQELKNEIRKQQEEYLQLYKEIKELQTGKVAEERLLAMWKEIEQEEEAKRLENIKLETEMREREQRKQELQRGWRVVQPTVTSSNVKTENTMTEVKSETTQKPKPAILQLQADNTTQPQTSPLLSSLLKSPTSNVPVSAARTAAPTITTLLTGGSISIKQPVVIINNTDVGQMLIRPASGPPTEAANSTQNLISPSQSAPTLSMLLEKNKASNTRNSPISVESNVVKVEKEQVVAEDVNKDNTNVENVPIEVDDIVTETTDMDVDETDPNEEQQLLEVFKNIGNIEMEIDAEFLTVMNEEPASENNDLGGSFDNKLESNDDEHTKQSEADTVKTTATTDELKEETANITTTTTTTTTTDNNVLEETQDNIEDNESKLEVLEEVSKTEIIKLETSSSDDSSDNMPLSNVANVQESKDEMKLEKSELEQAIKSEEVQIVERNVEEYVEIKQEENTTFENDVQKVEEDEVVAEAEADQREAEEETVELENENVEQKLEEVEEPKENEEEQSKNSTIDTKTEETKTTKTETNFTEDMEEVTQIEIIPIMDTDTDSSEVEKTANLEQKQSNKNERIKTERLISEDSDSTTLSITPALPPTVTPARPPALRKLRERDRSESPMIGEDDTEHVTSTNLRLRRRASSTPLIDSIPNSPASVSDREDRELRTAYKKSLLSVFNLMQQKHGKNISLLEESFSKSSQLNAAKYEEVCLRPMDFQVIQQSIENGSIRNTLELQRDILLMCQNALMLYGPDTEQHNAAMQLKLDCRNISDMCQISSDKVKLETRVSVSSSTASNTPVATNTSASKSRSGFRKSQRIS